VIKIEQFSCKYDNRLIINGLDAEFHKGEIAAILGSSGVGKSTLLKAINRLHEIQNSNYSSSGSICVKLNGELKEISSIEPTFLRRKVGYIFQSPTPLPMSIYQNVSFGLKIQGIKDKSRIIEALKSAYLWNEVKDRLHQSASTLSLGQQQRLAIARVLVLEPEILLLDEPTSSLDTNATIQIEQTIERLKSRHTIVLVTHDENQIDRICDKKIVIR
jgi:phosphate transport system ATP-binding protein